MTEAASQVASKAYGENSVTITVQQDLYSKSAVFGAAYLFIDSCYIFLDVPTPNRIAVELKSRGPVDKPFLEQLAGRFCNELLAQAFRQEIAYQNKDLLEVIVAQSLSSANVQPPPSVPAAPSIDLSELEGLDLDDEPFEDPLGIAVSWEDKHGKKKNKDEDNSTD